MTTKEYELNLSMEELEKRTHKDYLTTKKMLDENAEEYTSLANGDKEALKYLVKAGDILEKINKQLDSCHNLPFEEFLNQEISSRLKYNYIQKSKYFNYKQGTKEDEER